MLRIDRFPTADAGERRLSHLRRLLQNAFGPRFTDDDWEHALGGLHLTAEEGRSTIGHASVVERLLEVAGQPWRVGYVEAVAVRPDRQGEGIGSALMADVAEEIRARHEMGALSTGRQDFYRRLGWESWRGTTWVRREPLLVRTPEEDDGVMVLRFGASLAVDVTAAISCDPRAGDDW